MMQSLSIQSFVMASGERYCSIVQRPLDIPLYFPNLFITTQLRNVSLSYSSMESAAGHLVVFHRFLSERGINLEQRLFSKSFFKLHEVDALRDFCQHKFKGPNVPKAGNAMFTLEELRSVDNFVTSETQYARLTTIADYCKWLAQHLLEGGGIEVSELIADMDAQIRARRPTRKGRNTGTIDRALDQGQQDALLEAIHLDSDINPFSKSVRFRNRLMVLILFYLGVRGGELLNLRIRDFDWGKNQVKIARRADEIDDPRTHQPLAKTLERILPLSDVLAKDIHEYITRHRRNIKNAKKHDFLFVTHKPGPTIGRPLSIAAYQKMLSEIRGVSPRLRDITGHMLRHTWNDRFSEYMDRLPVPDSEVIQEQNRSRLMGWKEGSGSAERYNKRFINKRSQEAALQLSQGKVRAPKGMK